MQRTLSLVMKMLTHGGSPHGGSKSAWKKLVTALSVGKLISTFLFSI